MEDLKAYVFWIVDRDGREGLRIVFAYNADDAEKAIDKRREAFAPTKNVNVVAGRVIEINIVKHSVESSIIRF